ncbi:carbohydrate ABC transporter permease [Serinibacter arcticus]|uniref:Putative alpha-xyloside ABC transporter, permease component n=1 Tax=Serinibacter arcticus TaxID=1655435 RepID=A0A4Z1E188_9MICO|nr:sugar ABC transporter permease [Serinibacter arcticus]TGO05120.1 putative alpha-xyloside ABC transporter, permease component [Serinibacter arcticus]
MSATTTRPHTPLPTPERSRTGPRSRRWWRSGLTAYGYLSPTLLVMLVMMAVPVVMVFAYSTLSNVIMVRDPEFVGLDNYATLLGDPIFRKALGQTGIFTVTSVVLHLVLGLTFAMMLNSGLLPRVASALFRVVFILPWVFTASIVVILWQLLLNPNGVINYVLQTLNLISTRVEWFSNPALALGTVIFINVWAGYPFFMISLLAGLQGIPSDLYEAAAIDGAGWRHRFFSITIPQLMPIILAMAMLDFIWNLQQFPIIFLATGGGPLNATETVATYTYNLAFSKRQFSMASASGVVLFLISAIVALFYVRHQKARD